MNDRTTLDEAAQSAPLPWADLPSGVIYYETIHANGRIGNSTTSPETAYKLGWSSHRIAPDEVQRSDKDGGLYLKDQCPMRTAAEWQIIADNTAIKELKEYLRDTDFHAIKYAEGRLTDDEYAEIGIEREKARQEINRLEREIATMLQ